MRRNSGARIAEADCLKIDRKEIQIRNFTMSFDRGRQGFLHPYGAAYTPWRGLPSILTRSGSGLRRWPCGFPEYQFYRPDFGVVRHITARKQLQQQVADPHPGFPDR